MKNFLYLFLVAAALCSFQPRAARAQCTYTAKASTMPLDFSNANTWQVTPSGQGCSPTPVSGSNAIIIISGLAVKFNVDYVAGMGGSITVENGGSLIGTKNLTIGDNGGNNSATTLSVLTGGRVEVMVLTLDKAYVVVGGSVSSSPPTSLTTACNLVLVHSEIIDNSQIIIKGSVYLANANNTLCGMGALAITGCLFGSNGATKKLLDGCDKNSNPVSICALRLPTPGCSPPLSPNNDFESECQGLISCKPLPVELVLFTASLTARQGVALHWVTASEKNSQHFIIERSADGTAFNALRTVAAAGTTQMRTTYDQIDEHPLFGTSYYRLRQVDTDGTTAFSPVQLIRLGSANGEGLAVYPSHEAQQWVVSSALPAAVLASGPASVQVFDALGRSQQVVITPEAGQAGRWVLDMRSRPAGLYIVRLESVAGAFSQRIVQ